MVGKELGEQIIVKVVDSTGSPVNGALLTFKVTAGAGSFFAGAGVTSADGTAKDKWTIGTSVSDEQRAEVRVVDQTTGATLFSAVVRATTKPDAPAAMATAGGNNQSSAANAATSDSLAATVLDKYGNPATGTWVQWTATNGTVSPGPDAGELKRDNSNELYRRREARPGYGRRDL